MTSVNLLEPIQIACLIVGAMMPYAFSALTMRSVGLAAAEMCAEIEKQIAEIHNPKERDPNRCIEISTNSSLREMILPGVMVIFTPLILGGFFGPKAVTGYLIGVIVSGVQMAIASSNSGGAWDNAKKYVEGKFLFNFTLAEKLIIEKKDLKKVLDGNKSKKEKQVYTQRGSSYYYKKGSKPHKAAVVGDTVGDPLKDTSGPSLNILIKLSAIVSLVFGGFFADHALIKF
jgi:inorganic pyrophosphatase